MEKYLPIGSVVLLEGATKRIMVCGRVQRKEGENEIYDYSGCLFPEGIINPHELYLFNHDKIERVYFIGLQDEEEMKFQNYMKEKIEEKMREQKE